MKIIKISLISIIVLIIVLVLGAIIFVNTFDVNRFKPQIINQASKVLNRKVDFERTKLAISLRQGISLKIKNLVIADDPAFGKGDFFSVKDISLAIDVLGYVFRKKINIPNVLIDSARLTIIRQKDGTLNVQSFAKPLEPEKEGVKFIKAPSPLVVPALLISSARGDNGTVSFIDHSFEPALALEISDLKFSVSKISLTEPFPFVVEGAILSAKKNIKLEGKARINLRANGVIISELKAATDLSDILLEKIPLSFPMAKGVILPVSLKGKVSAVLQKLIVGSDGLTVLNLDASLANGALQFKEMASPIKDVRMNVKITEKKVLLEKVSASIGEGIINGSGSIEDYLTRQNYSMEVSTQNLKIQDLIIQDKSPVKTEGLASGEIKLKGQGFSPQAFRTNSSGGGYLSVTKVKLKDINVLRTVLDKISVIPGLAQKIENRLPERFKQKLAQRDTILSDIKLPLTIENSRIVIKDTVFGADEFLFKGRGEVGFDSAFSLEGSFLIPEELSASMVEVVAELQYLLNDSKQIYIPLKVSGKAGELKFRVDAEYIAQKLLANQARQQLYKALDKAIGTKETEATEQNAPQEGSSEKPTKEELIDNILDKIFK